jgi:crossover junction endonuclease MUS81
VLDYIAERKNVNDLLGSIRNDRYVSQKTAMLNSGLRNLLYIIEGDNTCLAGIFPCTPTSD